MLLPLMHIGLENLIFRDSISGLSEKFPTVLLNAKHFTLKTNMNGKSEHKDSNPFARVKFSFHTEV